MTTSRPIKLSAAILQPAIQELGAQQRALVDVSNRAKLGIFVYPLLWAVVAYTCGLLTTAPQLTWISSGLFVINSILRLILQAKLPGMLDTRLAFAEKSFVFLVLWNGAQWSILCSICILYPELKEAKMPLMISGAGILAGGTIIMAINAIVRIAFPIIAVTPVIVALILMKNAQDLLLAAMCGIFLAYILGASAVVHRDYWNASTASDLLTQRAQELEELSTTDTLTKLRNRLYFNVTFDNEWKRACRQHHSIAVLLIDLDHFKQINDSYGHAIGDYCLQQSASTLATTIRRTGDVVARYGGEEFIVALPNTTLDDAIHLAQSVLEKFRNLNIVHGEHRIIVTASIGVAAVIPQLPDEGFRLINAADSALYQAKHSGRNRYYAYSEAADLRPSRHY